MVERSLCMREVPGSIPGTSMYSVGDVSTGGGAIRFFLASFQVTINVDDYIAVWGA